MRNGKRRKDPGVTEPRTEKSIDGSQTTILVFLLSYEDSRDFFLPDFLTYSNAIVFNTIVDRIHKTVFYPVYESEKAILSSRLNLLVRSPLLHLLFAGSILFNQSRCCFTRSFSLCSITRI
jgi:hypothetical protein